jgi:hypothetical protein
MDSSDAVQALGGSSIAISKLIGMTHFSTSPDDQETLSQLFRARDQINWTAQQLIGNDLSGSLSDYEDACAAIKGATDRLVGIKSAVDSAENALEIATKIVSIGSQILAKVV